MNLSEDDKTKLVSGVIAVLYFFGTNIWDTVKERRKKAKEESAEHDIDHNMRHAERRLHEFESEIDISGINADEESIELLEERNLAIYAMKHYRRRLHEEHTRAEHYRELYEATFSESDIKAAEVAVVPLGKPYVNEFRVKTPFWRKPIILFQRHHEEEKDDRP